MDAAHRPISRSISVLCCLGLFLSGCLFYTSGLIQPYYAVEFHLTDWQMGIAQSAVPLGAMIGAIQAGWLADRFGRHRVLRLSFLLLTISGVWGAFASNFNYLCVSRGINGYLAGTLYPLCAAYLIEMTPHEQVPKRVATMMFINCFASPIACVFVYILSHLVSDHVLWHLLAGMHVVPAMIAFIWSASFPESNTWLFFMETTHPAPKRMCFRTKMKTLFSPAYRNVTLCLLGTWFLMDVAYYGINFFIPHLLSVTAETADALKEPLVMQETLIINAFFGIGAALSILAIQRINQYKLQKVGFLLSGISMLALGYYFYGGLHHSYLIVALFVIFNFSINAGPNVTTYLLPATSYPVEVRATGHGLSAGIAKLGCFLGVLLLPGLQASVGFGTLLFGLALLLFIGYWMTLVLAKSTAHDAIEEVEAVYESATN